MKFNSNIKHKGSKFNFFENVIIILVKKCTNNYSSRKKSDKYSDKYSYLSDLGCGLNKFTYGSRLFLF